MLSQETCHSDEDPDHWCQVKIKEKTTSDISC